MKFRQMLVMILICFSAGLGGGFIVRLLTVQKVFAQNNQPVLATEELHLVNTQGKTSGRWISDFTEGSGIFIYDHQNHSRLELNLFSDGRPVLALNDDKHLCKFLFKLEWEKNIPMLFMKEPADCNRLIMALDLKNSEIPFLVLLDEKSQKKEIFGKFEMP